MNGLMPDFCCGFVLSRESVTYGRMQRSLGATWWAWRRSGGDERHFALFFACRFHRDFNVLAESGKKIEQAAYGKVSGPVAQQSGNMGLGEANDFADFPLRQLAVFDDAINLQRQTRFH